jgi:outer membrane protein assembly factor BamB
MRRGTFEPTLIPLAVIALLLVSDVARSQKADWPHLRGPNYDGVSREGGLVESWPDDGPPILWTRELGQGYSGIVAAQGRVFTQFQTRTGQYVIALNGETGEEVWRRRIDWPWQPAGAYPGPYATPTWHAGRLYYATPLGLVGCLDAATGTEVWSLNVRKTFKGEGTEFGYASTPLVEDGKVILPVGGPGASVVALDARDGSTLWASGDDAASYCPAYPITFRGRRLVIAYLRNVLAAHDLATGERLWRMELSQHYDEHSAWPLYAEPDLLLAAPFRVGAQLYRLADGGARPVWASRVMSNDVCSSVLLDGLVYGFDLQQSQASPHRASRGRFKCLDFLTGKVRWETDQVGQATVLAADGKLILLNETGTLILARATPSAYVELARARVLDAAISWTPPTLVDGRLYVRNHSRAVCLFLGSPDKLDPQRPQQPIPTGPWFDWASLLTREPEYPHDAPAVKELALWFAWCVLGVFAPAAAVAALVWLRRPSSPEAWGSVVFVGAAVLLGLAGTSLFSVWANAFVFTWPAALYVAFRVTLAVIVWAEAKAEKKVPRRVSRVVTLLFLAAGYGYYRLCLAVGYVMGWAFLAGFLPAAPFAIVAARVRSWWVSVLADSMAFSVFFWVAGLLPGLKEEWFR